MLGGSGGMGRYAVRAALTLQGISELVVADLNAEGAKAFIESDTIKELAQKTNIPLRAIGCDVTDAVGLRAAMRVVDVVLNTVGPYFRFGVPILSAAIECKIHFLDICDDWEPTLEMLKMHEAAEAAGVTCVVGLGASPGLTNLMGLAVMQELDTCDTVYTGWDLGGALPALESTQIGTGAAYVHGVRQMAPPKRSAEHGGKVKALRGGKLQMLRPLMPVRVSFPGLKGQHLTRLFGHPENVTFAHHYPELKTALNVTTGPVLLVGLVKRLRWLVDVGLMKEATMAKIIYAIELDEIKGKLKKAAKIEAKTGKPCTFDEIIGKECAKYTKLPVVWALAEGTKDGKPASVAIQLKDPLCLEDGSMGVGTGNPLAIGLKMLLEGKLTKRGVFAPEGAGIEPYEFLEAFDLSCKEPVTKTPGQGLRETVILTRSWEL